MDDRITSLEEEIAHLTRSIEELSGVIARQDRDIETLTRRVEMLLQRAAEQEASGDGGVVVTGEKPPHW